MLTVGRPLYTKSRKPKNDASPYSPKLEVEIGVNFDWELDVGSLVLLEMGLGSSRRSTISIRGFLVLANSCLVSLMLVLSSERSCRTLLRWFRISLPDVRMLHEEFLSGWISNEILILSSTSVSRLFISLSSFGCFWTGQLVFGHKLHSLAMAQTRQKGLQSNWCPMLSML